MLGKRMVVWVGLAALTTAVVGCGHVEKVSNKLAGATKRVEKANTGVDEVNQAIQGKPSVAAASPGLKGQPKKQSTERGVVPAAIDAPKPE